MTAWFYNFSANVETCYADTSLLQMVLSSLLAALFHYRASQQSHIARHHDVLSASSSNASTGSHYSSERERERTSRLLLFKSFDGFTRNLKTTEWWDRSTQDSRYYQNLTIKDIPLLPGFYRALYVFREIGLVEDQIVKIIGRGDGIEWAVLVVSV
ncbi:hypothetical protein K435DRAFT_859785 [Dendrothele bispora CBS 962.96]|uniref:Uncharacterized protein n=1 Tax=Dendrothele bispora (strain CBS 962.96) TaxID=1314807 RepID=A0A4S8M042_DENBC|nr:hypothetical protein K435DRAFT_859785 [Dendrothele bispora CBS 962.96]